MSDKRLSEAKEERRDRSAASSSAPPRLNFPEVTSPGFANRILGAGEGFAEPSAAIVALSC